MTPAFLFSLSMFFFFLPLLGPPSPPQPPTLRTLRFGCQAAAKEKNVDNEIRRKVCRFARGAISKASGGLGGLQSRVQSKHLARVSVSFFFFSLHFNKTAVCFGTGEQEGWTERRSPGFAKLDALSETCQSVMFFFFFVGFEMLETTKCKLF